MVKINNYQTPPHLSLCTPGQNLVLDKRKWRLSNQDCKTTNKKVFEQGISNQNLFQSLINKVWISLFLVNQFMQPIMQLTVMYAGLPR